METPTVMAGRVTSDLLLVGSLPVGSTDAALTRSPHTVYRRFRELRAEGVIPAHLRFQVGLPFALSGLSGFKENFAADYPIASRGYEDMVAHELERLTVEVPPEELAIQWDVCYEVLDIEGGLLVRMANYAVANSGRTVDWLHLAGPRYLRSEDDRFFRPLRELRVGHTRVFLGIVLPIDGIPGLRRGKATAARYLTDFGVAM